MKKLLVGLLVLFAGTVLTGCSLSEDEIAVNDVYGRIIITADVYGIKRDFYLSKTEIDGVTIEWKSSNDAIKIVEEDYQGTYDDKEYEYARAAVTTSDAAVTVELTATLTKGEATKEWTTTCKVLKDEFITVTSYDELEALATGDLVRVTVEVVSVNLSSLESYSNFEATLKFDGEEITFIGYRVGKAYVDYFEEGNKIMIEATRGYYGDKAQLTSVEYVKFA